MATDPLECPKCSKTAKRREMNPKGTHYIYTHLVGFKEGIPQSTICTVKKEEVSNNQ